MNTPPQYIHIHVSIKTDRAGRTFTVQRRTMMPQRPNMPTTNPQYFRPTLRLRRLSLYAFTRYEAIIFAPQPDRVVFLCPCILTLEPHPDIERAPVLSGPFKYVQYRIPPSVNWREGIKRTMVIPQPLHNTDVPGSCVRVLVEDNADVPAPS